jgi:hypothetical protein
MTRIHCIAMAVPIAVCLIGVFARPARAQDCDTSDGRPDCYAENQVVSAPCKVTAVCLDLVLDECGEGRLVVSVSIPEGEVCHTGEGTSVNAATCAAAMCMRRR